MNDVITIVIMIIMIFLIGQVVRNFRRGDNYHFGEHVDIKDIEKIIYVLSESNVGAYIKMISNSFTFPIKIYKCQDNMNWWLEFTFNHEDFELIKANTNISLKYQTLLKSVITSDSEIFYNRILSLNYDQKYVVKFIQDILNCSFGFAMNDSIFILFKETKTLTAVEI